MTKVSRIAKCHRSQLQVDLISVSAVLSTEELKTVEKEISSLNDINAKHKRLWEHYKSLVRR